VTGGVDAALFQSVPPDPELATRLAGRRVLLYVGRFVPLKNLPMLIDAYARVRQAREDVALVLVGEGALEGQIRDQVGRLGLTDAVTFLGHQPQSRLPALYAASEIVLLSSSFDNSPNCVLEANACERPVVATRVGGVPRYVTEGENGLLVACPEERRGGGADGFAKAILELLERPGAPLLAQERREAGRPLRPASGNRRPHRMMNGLDTMNRMTRMFPSPVNPVHPVSSGGR
jgi:glycosyltransferase involved in cell wall biosynthesis